MVVEWCLGFNCLFWGFGGEEFEKLGLGFVDIWELRC